MTSPSPEENAPYPDEHRSGSVLPILLSVSLLILLLVIVVELHKSEAS